MGLLNAREVASAIWFSLLVIWALTRADFRRSVASALRATFRVQIIVPVILVALYMTGIAVGLSTLGLWNMSLLKDTIVWFFLSALAMMMRFLTLRNPQHIFRQVAADSLKVIILFEFIVNTYTFSLPAELVLVPVLAVIAMLSVVSHREGQQGVSRFIAAAQAVAGLTILAFAIGHALNDLASLESLDTLRSILLAPVLSIAFSPLLYAMVLASTYEQVFRRVTLGREKDRKLKRYARLQVFRYAGLNIQRLNDLLGRNAARLMSLASASDVDRLLQEVRASGATQPNQRLERTQ